MGRSVAPRIHTSSLASNGLNLLGFVFCNALFFSLLFLWYHLYSNIRTTNDFVQYWTAFQLAWNGSNPYDSLLLLNEQRYILDDITKAVMMWNPPWILLALTPLLIFSYSISLFFYLFLGMLTFLSQYWITAVSSHSSRSLPSPRSWALFLFAVFTFYPTLAVVEATQSSILVLLGVTLVLVSEQAKQRALLLPLGFLLCALKPHISWLLLLFLVVWALRNLTKREALVSLFVFIVVLGSVELAFPGIYLSWITAIAQKPTDAVATFEWIPYSLNQVPYFMCSYLLERPFTRSFATTTSLCMLGFGLLVWGFACRPKITSFFSGVGATLCVSLMFAPHLFPWDYVVLLPFYLHFIFPQRGVEGTVLTGSSAALLASNLVLIFSELFVGTCFYVSWIFPSITLLVFLRHGSVGRIRPIVAENER